MTKYAVVTGASRGLGKAIALAVARAGYFVFLVARKAETLEPVLTEIREAGGDGEVAVADLLDETAVAQLKSQIETKTDTLHLLAQVAGAFAWDTQDGVSKPGPTYEKLYAINVTTKWNVWFALGSLVKSAGAEGTVLTVASQAADFEDDHPYRQDQTGYGNAMRMVKTFHNELADELADAGTQLILSKPPLVDTALAREGFSDENLTSRGMEPIDWSTVPSPETFVRETITIPHA